MIFRPDAFRIGKWPIYPSRAKLALVANFASFNPGKGDITLAEHDAARTSIKIT
jgi:hypothetical protein